MTNKKFLPGILVLMLVIGLTAVGCGNLFGGDEEGSGGGGGGGGGSGKTTITLEKGGGISSIILTLSGATWNSSGPSWSAIDPENVPKILWALFEPDWPIDRYKCTADLDLGSNKLYIQLRNSDGG